MVVRFERIPIARPLVGDILDVERSIDSLFDGFFDAPTAVASRLAPAMDVAEYPAETVVVAEVPGIKKEEVKISFEKGLLTISGERKPHPAPDGSSWLRNEIRSGSFSRTLEVGHDVKAEGITAELADGVLKVVLPRSEQAKPREIVVR